MTDPIDIQGRLHLQRDSLALSAGIGGVSWGRPSVSSFFHSVVPQFGFSNHNNNGLGIGSIPSQGNGFSSSYLPSLEAKYCRDYSCCGEVLPTLHHLLSHYEETHSGQPPMGQHQQHESRANTSIGLSMGVPTTEVFINNNELQLTNMEDLHFPDHNFPPADDLDMNMDMDLDMDMDMDDSNDHIADPARNLFIANPSESKPYKCSIRTCNKTYKNTNGLKYHMAHGHKGQSLRKNDDGTQTIIGLEGVGELGEEDMLKQLEQDKPHMCTICGRRYKNLNGLKYHKAHSAH